VGQAFGTTDAGEPVLRLRLTGGGLTASILTWGAVIQDLRIDGHAAPLVLGYERLEDYVGDRRYFGALVGRNANRLRAGAFAIDGTAFAVEAARPEANGLHGGSQGYAHRNWSVEAEGPDFAVLSLADPDGTMGFPGTVTVRCTYRLAAPGTLSMALEATTDRPTLCNLAQHSYFNLDDGGESAALDHLLRIDADSYLPADAELIPTGEVRAVAGTDFDFRELRPIRREGADGQVRYDANFCLSSRRGPLKRAALARGPRSGVEMEVWTTEPGVQFYCGHYIEPDTRGLGERLYDRFAGFCLEAQSWPDSPNHAAFPQAILRPGETYRQQTDYRFRTA
jgi:aldose 1-epimerase